MERLDETGHAIPEKTRKKLDRIKEDRLDREYVRTTIESPGWRVFYERTLGPRLADWKRALLTQQNLPEEERRALILARQTLLQGLELAYKETGAHIPEWFAEELQEL